MEKVILRLMCLTIMSFGLFSLTSFTADAVDSGFCGITENYEGGGENVTETNIKAPPEVGRME